MSLSVEEEKERTIWCGNLHPKVTEEILYELFLQAGPLEKVTLVPNKNFAFITFKHSVSVQYAMQLMNGIRLFYKSILLQPRSGANNGASAATQSGPGLAPVQSLASLLPNPQVMSPAICSFNVSTVLVTPPMSGFVQNVNIQSGGNLPFHRSMSQPTFIHNEKQISNTLCNVVNATQSSHSGGKVRHALHYPNHQNNQPYNRAFTPDQRNDRNTMPWNASYLSPFQIQMGLVNAAAQFNGMGSQQWSNQHQRNSHRRY